MGILQEGILEWVAMPSSGDLPDPEIEPRSPALQVDSLLSEPPGKPNLAFWSWLVVQLLSRVRLFETPRTIARPAPLSTGILQAGILEWVAMPSSRGSFQPRDQTQISCIAGGFFTV